MRRILVALLTTLAAAAVVSGSAGSAAGRSGALSCGLPETQPVWIDFADGAVSFWRERFARPGVVIATGGPALAAQARAAGAATADWDMYLNKRVGTPSAPADPSLIERRADSLFDYAVTVTACQTPLIALNELAGASMPTPLTPTAERYRANVLQFVTRLAQRGARPALLVPGAPFTGGDAGAWWKAISAVSDIVLEHYENENVVWRQGPIAGSRWLRVRHRTSVSRFLALGVPPSRLGIMIGFQTNPGSGGREGLEPRSRWFEVAKWHALAARQVAKELKLAHVWSWGWAQRDAPSGDPDKTYAACVWLWTRDASLCDAPGILGKEFDPDVQSGQLDLPPGTRCMYGSVRITASNVASLARVTGDGELALTALVVRAVESARAPVSPDEALALEGRIVAARFGGDRASYLSALADVHATAPIARAILADELRTRKIAERLATPSPAAVDIARFRSTYAFVAARQVVVSPAPSWLPAGRGVALATSAPPVVFTAPAGRRTTIKTADGRLSVEPLDDTTPLGALPADVARPAVTRELLAQARAASYADWSLRLQSSAQATLACERDRMPELAVVALSDFAPFLSLDEAEAGRWAAVAGSRGPS